MYKYNRVKKENETLAKNEIKVSGKSRLGPQLKYLNDLFTVENFKEVTIKGTGVAISKVMNLAEIAKRRIVGLHQLNSIQNIDIVDEYEPLEEGLDHLTFTRTVSML
jgi:DNA-binding protein